MPLAHALTAAAELLSGAPHCGSKAIMAAYLAYRTLAGPCLSLELVSAAAGLSGPSSLFVCLGFSDRQHRKLAAPRPVNTDARRLTMPLLVG
jgi:hypothetical protein